MKISGPPWSSLLLAAWLVERGVAERQATMASSGGGDDPGSGHDGHLHAALDLGGATAFVDAGRVWPAGAEEGSGPASGDQSVAEARFEDTRIDVPFPGADTPRLLTAALTHSGRDTRYDAALSVAAGWGP